MSTGSREPWEQFVPWDLVNGHEVFTAKGVDYSLGRDTVSTMQHWDSLISNLVQVAPHVFSGQIPEESPNIRRFYHASFLSQRGRGYCVGFNWCGTVQTRLRIPQGASSTLGDPLPLVKLSPLYIYDVGRWACGEAGINLGWGDGIIGSIAAKGTQNRGLVLWDEYDSSPRAIDSHKNGTKPPSNVVESGKLHPVKDLAIAESFDHALELIGGGFPTAA